MDNSARYLAFLALRQMDRKQAYANIALDRVLSKSKAVDSDRHLATELVYGITRHQRTLDALIEQFSRRKSAAQQPPDLRRLLHLGFYQLHYLDRIPPSAAVNTTVELTRRCKLGGLTKVVNGILRSYLRTPAEDLLPPDPDPIIDLARRYSYPEWLLELWLDELGRSETEALCHWFNQPPAIDLRVNTHRGSLDAVRSLLAEHNIVAHPIEDVPGALRLQQTVGNITELPGYGDGLWMVQDCSAQQVALLLDPQPRETIVDCCAAPGGKTTHIAELMGDRGTVWGLDKHAGRLRRVKANAKRLQLDCIRTEAADLTTLDLETVTDSGELPQSESCDRALVDAPCSGLGTLHRHADARWRQQLDTIDTLLETQADILNCAAGWVKPGGIMVYSTCTIFAPENHEQIERFLETHDNWQLDPEHAPLQNWPHRDGRDGFYMARLQKLSSDRG